LQITAFIKACKEQIDILKNSIRNEESNSKGWLGLAAAAEDNFNADTIAHNTWRRFDSEREASFSRCTV
ncbi:unnamed protein product, partial [Brassica rapa]